MPSLDAFIESLTQDKVVLIKMGTLKTLKDHVLASLGRNNLKSKGKLKMKEKNPNSYSEDEGSNFKKKGKKKE